MREGHVYDSWRAFRISMAHIAGKGGGGIQGRLGESPETLGDVTSCISNIFISSDSAFA